MFKMTLRLVVVLLLAVPIAAQQISRVEIFGGYQYTRFLGSNFNGWGTAVTTNLNKWVGVTADISGAYRPAPASDTSSSITNIQISFRQYNFLFGPTFSYNSSERVKPFGHALFGVSHLSSTITSNLNSGGTLSTSDSDNAFGMALGGGIDVGVHKNVAVRLVQADYFLTKFGGGSQNNARISTGLVFRF